MDPAEAERQIAWMRRRDRFIISRELREAIRGFAIDRTFPEIELDKRVNRWLSWAERHGREAIIDFLRPAMENEPQALLRFLDEAMRIDAEQGGILDLAWLRASPTYGREAYAFAEKVLLAATSGKRPAPDAPEVGYSEWAMHNRVAGKRVMAFLTDGHVGLAVLEDGKVYHALDTEILPGRQRIIEFLQRPQPILWTVDA